MIPMSGLDDRIGVAVVKKSARVSSVWATSMADSRWSMLVRQARLTVKTVLDPGTIIFQDKIGLYYTSDGPEHVSTIGLAVSDDGIHFEKVGPIMPGRTPELVLNSDGILSMLYQTFDPTAKLLPASGDLDRWTALHAIPCRPYLSATIRAIGFVFDHHRADLRTGRWLVLSALWRQCLSRR